jgi:gas vesicle protein
MSRELRRRRAADAELSKQTVCFLLGGVVGAAVALLFAPKSGRELRGDIADATRKGVDRTRETAQIARERAGEYYGAAQARAGELAGSVREAAARRGEHLSAAVEAGRRAYREEKDRTGGAAPEALGEGDGGTVGNG